MERQGERGGEAVGGGIKTDRDRERMCEEVCVSERASKRVCVKAKQSVAVAEAVQQQQR